MKTKLMFAIMSVFLIASCTEEEKMINGMTQEEYNRKTEEISAETNKKIELLKQEHKEFKDSINSSY